MPKTTSPLPSRSRLARPGLHLRIALLTGVLFGLLPALRISKLDVNSVLKEASRRSGTGLRHNRIRSVLSPPKWRWP